MEVKIKIDDRIVQAARKLASRRIVGVLGLLSITVPLAIYADVPHIFEDGNIIYDQDMNENFEDLDSRLEGYESTIHVDAETGNVGIGTEEPSQLLDVRNTSDHARILLSSGVDKDTSFVLDGDHQYTVYNDGDGSVGPADYFHIYDGTAGLSRLTVDTSGHVGIGTTSPLEKLHVHNGNLLLTRTDGGRVSANLYQSNADLTWQQVVDNGGRLNFRCGTGIQTDPDLTTNMVTFTNSGSVGIGTTDPNNRLHVVNGNIEAESRSSGARIGFVSRNPDGFAGIFSGGGHGAGLGFYTDSEFGDFYAAKVIIQSGTGNVGIGTTTPSCKLDVAGAMHAESYDCASDARLKRDIQPLEDALPRLLSLSGVSFRWKDSNKDPGAHLGVIAQEVEDSFPELVRVDNKGYKSVNYDGLTAPIIEAIKTQQEIIDAQEQALEAQEQRLEVQEQALEAQNQDIETLQTRVAKQDEIIAALSARSEAQGKRITALIDLLAPANGKQENVIEK